MNKIILITFYVILLSACNSDLVQAVEDNIGTKKVWVFAHFNIPKEGKRFDSNYYYGKISDKLYNRIKANRIKNGFIYLEDVKYWGDDDKIHEYEDGEYTGDMIFRIEDIRKIRGIKKEPIAGLGDEQFKERKEDNSEIKQSNKAN